MASSCSTEQDVDQQVEVEGRSGGGAQRIDEGVVIEEDEDARGNHALSGRT